MDEKLETPSAGAGCAKEEPGRRPDLIDVAQIDISMDEKMETPSAGAGCAKEAPGRRPVLIDVALMSICFCLGMGALFASVSVVSLVVAEVVNPGLALVPPGLQKLVSTFVAFPGARHKNRRGFACSALLGAIGYTVAAGSVWLIRDPVTSFAVLCFGYCIAGFSDPFVQFLRFAAADISPEDFKPRAIAWVLAGGSLAALMGPELANIMADLVPGHRYVGSYVGAALVLLLEFCIILFIDFSPAPKSRADVKPDVEAQPTPTPIADLGLGAIVRQPRFVLVASTAVISQLTMICLMQIVPLAMKVVGFELWHAVRVVQGHILGMYLPSFFTGELLIYFGKHRVMFTGIVVNLVAACCLLIDRSSFWTYGVGLTVIGLGWNWAFVSATSLLTDMVDPFTKADQARAKGFNDLCIQLFGALGTLGTGFVVQQLGWEALVMIAAVILGAQLLIILLLPLLEGRASKGV